MPLALRLYLFGRMRGLVSKSVEIIAHRSHVIDIIDADDRAVAKIKLYGPRSIQRAVGNTFRFDESVYLKRAFGQYQLIPADYYQVVRQTTPADYLYYGEDQRTDPEKKTQVWQT